MAKRVAERELTDRNWDQEDEVEEAGTFSVASKAELQRRQIKTAKRSLPSTGSGAGGSSFAGFGGLSFKPTQTSTPFNINTKSFTNGKTEKPGQENVPKVNGEPEKMAAKKDAINDIGKEDNSKYISNLRSLNESVLAWIKQHVEKNPYCILTPIFTDYEKHLKNIENEKSNSSITKSPVKDSVDQKSATTKTDTQPSLSAMFKTAAGTWTCDTCLIQNKADVSKCVACQTAKPGGGSTSAAASSPAQAKKDTQPSLSAMFKAAAGTWTCDTCLIQNKADVSKCVACQTAKPGGGSTSAAASNPTQAKKDTQPSLSAMFKVAAGTWTCDMCLIQNKPDVSKCVACQTAKPGGGSSPPKTNSGGIPEFGSKSGSVGTVSPGFKFTTGTSESSVNPSGFKFGASQGNSTTSEFKFEASKTTNSSIPSGFAFGKNEPKSSTAGFTFGKSEDKLSAPGFAFGKNEDKSNTSGFGKSEEKSTSGFSFGKSEDKSVTSGFSFGKKDDKSTTSGFSFGKSEDKSTSGFTFGKSENKSTTPGFAFGKSGTTDTSSEVGFNFGSGTQPSSISSGFSFGTSNETNSAPKPGFAFGSGNGSTTADGAKGFSFAPSTTSSASSFGPGFFSRPTAQADATGASTQDEEEYEPPKVESTEITEEGSLYSVKCKLFYQREGKWTEKGVGFLHLKKADAKLQLVVRADTTLGNILLNIILSPAIPLKRQGTNNVNLFCVPNPKINKKDEDNVPVAMLVRVKNAEAADLLLQKMEELRKE